MLRGTILFTMISAEHQPGTLFCLQDMTKCRAMFSLLIRLSQNPLSLRQHYEVNIYRLVCSIMLGVVTYDDNLLVIEPPKEEKKKTGIQS